MVITPEELPNITTFIQSVTAASYAVNSDGDGAFITNGSDKIVKKSKEKIDYTQFDTALKQANFIITHQRYATSGKHEKYTHPFYNDDFVLFHNGVLSGYVNTTDEHSDTFNLFRDIKDTFKDLRKVNKTATREQLIVTIIKSIFDDLPYGTFSIVLYDRIDNYAYYFKNDSTNMHLKVFENSAVYMTTSEDNLLLTSLIPLKSRSRDIKDYAIYKIFIDGGKVKIHKIGKIKKKISAIVTTTYGTYNTPIYSTAQSAPVTATIEQLPAQEVKIDKGKITEVNDLHRCDECGTYTYNYVTDLNAFICDTCLTYHNTYSTHNSAIGGY